MVTFTSYGRADQLQIFRLLRLNCKLLIMSSDAVVFSANENLGNALVPPWFLVHEGPCAAPCMQSPRTFDPVWTWLTPQAPVWKNASPTPLGGFQILKSELSAHSRAFVLLYWMGIYLLKWNGQYLGIYILFIRLKEGENTPNLTLHYSISSEVKCFMPGQVSQKHKAMIQLIGGLHHSSTNNGEKMRIYKQTGRKSFHPPWECV